MLVMMKSTIMINADVPTNFEALCLCDIRQCCCEYNEVLYISGKETTFDLSKFHYLLINNLLFLINIQPVMKTKTYYKLQSPNFF